MAALYLGFHDGTELSAATLLRKWQHDGDNARKYSRALALLADRITADPHGVDYQLRREQLRTWVIPPDEWTAITEKVTQRQLPRIRPLTRWSPARRLAASAVVWAWATQGYYWLAPMRHYQRHRLPAPQMSETGREAGRIIQAGGQGSVYRLLNETLWDFCTNLTARIDAGLAATGAPWSNPPGPDNRTS
jgi:hypothetical protein